MDARAYGRSFSRLRPAGSCSGLPSPRGRPNGLLGGPRGCADNSLLSVPPFLRQPSTTPLGAAPHGWLEHALFPEDPAAPRVG